MLRFGTDGVRGLANVDLTPELVLALGRAIARVVGGPRLVIGRDTRASGPLLEAALVAGTASEGVDGVRLGEVPTPAVAWAGHRLGVAGAVISASHNPFADNGVKVFAPGGRKLAAEVEAELEAELHRILAGRSTTAPRDGAAVGSVHDGAALVEGWIGSVATSIGERRLDALSVVVDCANGAASHHAPRVLRDLGAAVEVIHAEPDGTNINAGCGSTHPDDLRAAVRRHGAHVGIAFDGDADRVLAVDEAGDLVDGDQIMAVLALDRHRRGALAGDAVVVTVMSNLGFRQAMARHGIEVVETPVGDRHVLEALERRGLNLGGEQSGHVILRDLATTGDGLLTAVQLLDLLGRTGRSLGELAAEAMTRLPQVLRNVRADQPAQVVSSMQAEVEAAQARLGDEGRILLRSSGTEPLVRVMVEATTEAVAVATADALARVAGDLAARRR